MEKKLSILFETGICAIIRSRSKNIPVEPLVSALYEGGIKVIEVTFNTAGAVSLISEIKKKFGEKIFTGAGTILDIESVKQSIDAGAQFLVSPHIDLKLIEYSRKRNIPFIPGAFSPTEVLLAWQNNVELVKLFPANVVGPSYIKALKSGPFPHIEIMPTGGINLENGPDFIKAGASVLGIGGELINDKLIHDGKWEVIKNSASSFIKIIKQARGKNG